MPMNEEDKKKFLEALMASNPALQSVALDKDQDVEPIQDMTPQGPRFKQLGSMLGAGRAPASADMAEEDAAPRIMPQGPAVGRSKEVIEKLRQLLQQGK